jgi:enoyl-CoA hydratase/carnithine racemase
MLRVEDRSGVVWMTLDRPEVRNALNAEMIAILTAAFRELAPGTRAVVLTGAGRSFCSGGDIDWMRSAAEATEEENFRDALALAELYRLIVESPAVVIAGVNGHAFGGGCGLVAAADVAIAARDALFAFSEVKLGLVPATISPYVIDKIGSGNARALFVTGDSFGAGTAQRIGLVHEVVELDSLIEAVMGKIASVLSAGPRAVAESKQVAQRPPESLEKAARLLARVRTGPEAKEGIAAFLEKRRPSFAAALPNEPDESA